MKADEISQLEAYMKRLFDNQTITVRPRPRKDDSAEVYVGEEFIGLMHRDDEDDDDLSYNFTMAILEIDLN
ncbi:MAG: DUF3126 family protein [Hyphomicrobiales bacterium]